MVRVWACGWVVTEVKMSPVDMGDNSRCGRQVQISTSNNSWVSRGRGYKCIVVHFFWTRPTVWVWRGRKMDGLVVSLLAFQCNCSFGFCSNTMTYLDLFLIRFSNKSSNKSFQISFQTSFQMFPFWILMCKLYSAAWSFDVSLFVLRWSIAKS